MPQTATPYTVITGASSGIGLHLAREFAKHGHATALVARDHAELARISADLAREFGTPSLPVACDLEDSESCWVIDEALADADGVVDILVNNAGRGQRGRFWEVPVETHLSILKLNVEAVLRLTALFLPRMLERGAGRILNTASIASFEAGPLLAVYHASKAFLLSWSEALAVELEDTPITVTALCPGPTDTDFFPKADMVDTRAFQEASVMPPQDVAAAGYAGLMAGERIIVPGAANKALVFSRRVLTETSQAKMNQALYERVMPENQTRQRGDIEGRDEGD